MAHFVPPKEHDATKQRKEISLQQAQRFEISLQYGRFSRITIRFSETPFVWPLCWNADPMPLSRRGSAPGSPPLTARTPPQDHLVSNQRYESQQHSSSHVQGARRRRRPPLVLLDGQEGCHAEGSGRQGGGSGNCSGHPAQHARAPRAEGPGLSCDSINGLAQGGSRHRGSAEGQESQDSSSDAGRGEGQASAGLGSVRDGAPR